VKNSDDAGILEEEGWNTIQRSVKFKAWVFTFLLPWALP
jgi:hypothetical protein